MTSESGWTSGPKVLRDQRTRGRTSNGAPVVNVCEACDESDYQESRRLYFCVSCDSKLCESCWSKQLPHKPGKLGADGLPHEQADFDVVIRLREILEPPSAPETQQTLHRDDEDTTWFGVVRDSQGSPDFQDYGRYNSIMAGSLPSQWPERFPHLVSFIGQTGAGKSTLVKMLIDFVGATRDKSGHFDKSTFPSPVVSTLNDTLPTSGDVHLYADPITYRRREPILYADCEGLEGGENIPRSVRYKEAVSPDGHMQGGGHQSHEMSFRRTLRRIAHPKRRKIAWAKTPETCKRQYAVTNLYPQLLYTFSDVVVFVLRNPKIFESTVLDKLLDWASKSLEKSLNQPALPHAIIVLNATDNSIGDEQWNSTQATNVLFSDIDEAMKRDIKYEEHVQFWRTKGRKVDSIKELLESYYSSVTVIRVPTKGRYMQIKKQIQMLYDKIVSCCLTAYINRVTVRMLSNADEIQVYLQSAFDHFSRNLDAPFNFVKITLKNNPIPLDFRGNILKLAVAIKERANEMEGRRILQELSPMVASCMLLNLVRSKLKGTPVQLFNDHYMEHSDRALYDFCDRYWPCSYQGKEGRCVNFKHGHSKGHQNEKGKIIAVGEYQSRFSAIDFISEWRSMLVRDLESLEQLLRREHFNKSNPIVNEARAAASLHSDQMKRSYNKLGSATEFVSHSNCFCCLFEPAEHPLPCGHVLCTLCVHSYGALRGVSSISINCCPLHPEENPWVDPWVIKMKPFCAGVRVLCLDGGGIRGIAELEVLAALERALDRRIPIQSFFDLMVGTSTGGIIALGLGVKEWRVTECISKFAYLCDKAFTLRASSKVPGVRRLTPLTKGGRYKTSTLEQVLRDSFKEEYLFGGQRKEDRYGMKVAVTSTVDTGQKAAVLKYIFQRPDTPDLELKTWEAARATSAAPGIFKHFTDGRTCHAYSDGALYHNNPIQIAHQERLLLWPEAEARPPDILISIGTGLKQKSTESEPPRKDTGSGRENTTPTAAKKKSGHAGGGKSRRSPMRWTAKSRTLETMVNRVDNVLDCERTWKSFVAGISESNRGRYHRLNVNTGRDPPRLDEKDKFAQFQMEVREELKEPAMKRAITRIAHQLIASSFFLHCSPPDEVGTPCKGEIRCRLEGSDLRALGDVLRSFQTTTFQPAFSLWEGRSTEPTESDVISSSIISDDITDKMIRFGEYSMPKLPTLVLDKVCTIALRVIEEGEFFPISGFPRTLNIDEQLNRNLSLRRPGPMHKRYSLQEPNEKSLRRTGSGDDLRTRSLPSLRLSLSNPDLTKAQYASRLSSLAESSPISG